MFCKHCGNELKDTHAFCINCGAKVTADTVVASPARKLKTNKSLLKYILLSLITLGIYPLVVMTSVSTSINYAASRYDGKNTMNFCLMAFLLNPITLGIASIVWYHKVSARIGDELIRRNIDYKFNSASYWLWNVLGSFIIVGPFIYAHKLFTATNKICEHYNIYG